MKGQLADMHDNSKAAEKARAADLCSRLTALPMTEKEERLAVMKELFGAIGENPAVMPGFRCDFGKNITIGKQPLLNFNVVIMDRSPVTIGDHVMIAPNVVITTSNHPLDPQQRRDYLVISDPITIGDDVWIGAGAVILPGTTIGNNVVVAAGAVVSGKVPDNTMVGGVPARKIRDL